MNKNYDWAAEMIKIASTPEHKNSFAPMEKVAFSRDGIDFTPIPAHLSVEAELSAVAGKDCSCDGSCSSDCDCSCHENKSADDGEVEVQASLSEVGKLMLEISDELEEAGHEKLAAATIAVVEMIKNAASGKMQKGTGPHNSAESKRETHASPYSSSPGSRTTHKSDKPKGKAKGKGKLTMKERMAKLRKAKKK